MMWVSEFGIIMLMVRCGELSMEVVVGIKGREAGITEDGAADKLSSGLAPLKEGADPVVYKLVRVGFDGRFVPATDDELMEVENLLELEKSELLSIPAVMDPVGCTSDKADTFERPLSEKDEGLSQMKSAKVEENSRAEAEDSLPKFASSSKGRRVKEFRDIGEELSSSLHDGSNRSGFDSKPNFSLIKGQINLDNLTIRELQETFRATFGRETCAKDKIWLKRRIAMGLTNSCDVSVKSFIINDGKFLKDEELSKNMDYEVSVAGEICNAGDDGPLNLVTCSNQREDAVDDDVELRNSLVESGCRSDDNLENRAAKRARKPTKRYIEELSDREKDSQWKATVLIQAFGT
ncbi:Protein RUBCNL-like [Bienertia sinuspersici]